MKFQWLLLSMAATICIVMPPMAQAHNADQLPFLKVNGKDAVIYPVGSTSLPSMVLPQDAAAEPYVVHSTVSFELQRENLPFLKEELPQLSYRWDFGDGVTSTEENPKHAYGKQGTYVVTLKSSNIATGSLPQILDIVAVQIIPNSDYVLPISKLTVNGQGAANPVLDVLRQDFKREMSFDSTGSSAGTSRIISYDWDLGDQTSASGPKLTHTYGTEWSYVAPILRIKTADGFFADAMIQIENPDPVFASPSPAPKAAARITPRQIAAAAFTAATLTVIGFFLAGRIRKFRSQ